ncbi:4'-phosphopantetheinyl transferase superfamily protein [Micromonospora sp. AMSO12t]|uniref:4'-phosphopantetheinyl transferase family protein n=1 Tax=unclassified Micromonospora TaxID=2617518 RepID=UPI00124B0736|nr:MULTISPECIES: 4'-phosphopantetheinyl transferase superfamily protein [unclassified Micromonospora]KAB1162359.1 4'-phosphopantetheinyl transferase superfamily protein [Micromonospora sp. AMSO12t]WSG01424.1 4'-phosphopantetheinyl transferase superfamily protein [Micromonospora sp. NBC_01740]
MTAGDLGAPPATAVLPAAPDGPPPATVPGPPKVPAAGQPHTWWVPVRPGGGRVDLLDPAERLRAEDLLGSPARDVFVTSRAAQRRLGSRYLGVPPAQVRIDRDCQYCAGTHGRPRFADSRVDYSVSHTEDWVLLAVAGVGLIGVDVERSSPDRDTDGLAAVALTANERELFARVPPADRPGWFLTAWTRKEAAMKLTGFGLRAPPGQLDVSGPTVTVGSVPGWPRIPVHLHDLPAPAGHAAALASTVPVRAVRSFPVPGERAFRATG